jgi:ribosome-interacting GTPase 1
MVYLDNIIIYLNSVEEYKEHIKWILRKLYKKNMPVTVMKYKFHTKKTNFVGFIIKLRQISIDLKKIKAIVNWQDLESVIGLKLFLKFCNYYHRFIAK